MAITTKQGVRRQNAKWFKIGTVEIKDSYDYTVYYYDVTVPSSSLLRGSLVKARPCSLSLYKQPPPECPPW